ncbi:MAG: hypothetical protein ABA06_04785 [Parcubacteria bacterium C7867-001]|nr:MAG: hypothetical protein ABA06_04785 [Parcubacteria bacterium C7867-001]
MEQQALEALLKTLSFKELDEKYAAAIRNYSVTEVEALQRDPSQKSTDGPQLSYAKTVYRYYLAKKRAMAIVT